MKYDKTKNPFRDTSWIQTASIEDLLAEIGDIEDLREIAAYKCLPNIEQLDGLTQQQLLEFIGSVEELRRLLLMEYEFEAENFDDEADFD